MSSVIFFFIAVVALAAASKVVDYSQHSLFAARNVNAGLLEKLQEKFDVWEHSQEEVQVFGKTKELEAFLVASGVVDFKIEDINMQQIIDNERARIAKYAKKPRALQRQEWHLEYHPFVDIVQYYIDRCAESPAICAFVPSVGNLTWLGYSIPATIGSPAGKPVIYWEFNIHAREWITSAAGQYIFDQILLRHAAGDAQVVNILQQSVIVFIPVVNPDGLVWTWEVDRMWRKNRRNNGGSYGVDLNRNFDANWGGGGSSGTPSSDTYRGPYVESEPEVWALARYFESLGNVVGAIDIHSYSQYILRPWTHVNTVPPHEAEHAEIGDNMRDLILSVHNRRYTSGRWFNTLYQSSGVAQDWWYAQGAYGFTIELRPTTSIPGFELPPDEIIPQGEELMPAMLYFCEAVVENPIRK